MLMERVVMITLIETDFIIQELRNCIYDWFLVRSTCYVHQQLDRVLLILI